MTNRPGTLFAAAACICLAISAVRAGDLFAVAPGAAEAFAPESFRTLNSTDLRFPWLRLSDSPLSSITTAMTSIRASSAPQHIVSNSEGADAKDSLSNFVERRPTYVGGEMGFLYGHSAGGRHSFDTEQGYIFGEVGSGNMQISVGASYQQWNSHGWHSH